MKFIILLLFLPLNLALSIGSPDEEVSTQLSDEIQVRWLTNISMEIKLPNNTMDTILLIPASNIPGVPTPCLFSGKLEKDKDSVVAVSGCQDDQETSLSIASRLVTDALVDLSIINGTTFIIGADLVAKERLRFKRQTGSEIIDENDYVLDPNPVQLGAAFTGPLPKSVILHTSVVYDNSLLQKFRGSHSNTKQWLSKVVELTKPRMKHNSLDVAIHLMVDEMKHRNDQIKADAPTIYRLASDNKQTNHVVSFFCEDVGGGVIGIAFLGTACRNNGYAININEYYSNTNSELKTARTFAHELGHNMDMRHDFDQRHGGRGNPCDGKGLMSYGNKPDAWSSCSNKDFDAWYRSEGSTCLISGPIKQELQAASAILSSTYVQGRYDFQATRCIDGKTGYHKDKDTRYNTMCHTDSEIYPWLALDLGKSVSVSSVKIYNRQGCCGDRLRDCEIRISDNLPTTPATESFKGGAKLGFFEGPGKNLEVIEISAERPLAGRYIVIMNNSKGRFDAAALNLVEVTAMG